jgi:hypothetical protein
MAVVLDVTEENQIWYFQAQGLRGINSENSTHGKAWWPGTMGIPQIYSKVQCQLYEGDSWPQG